MRRLLSFASIVAICGLLACASSDRDSQSQADRPMPTFSMRDTTGQVISNDSLKGHVYLIDFWATWCGPCRQLSPVLDKISKKYADKGVVVIGADTGEKSPGDHAAAYKKEHGYSYRFSEANDTLSDSMGVSGFPTVFIVDGNGTIRHVMEGYGPESEKELDDEIEQLLGNRA